MGKADPPNNNKKTSILVSSSFRNQLQFLRHWLSARTFLTFPVHIKLTVSCLPQLLILRVILSFYSSGNWKKLSWLFLMHHAALICVFFRFLASNKSARKCIIHKWFDARPNAKLNPPLRINRAGPVQKLFLKKDPCRSTHKYLPSWTLLI